MDALNRLGFHSTSIGREIAASRYHVEGVPLLEVEAPDGSVRFRGGYRKRNVPNDEYLDTAIVSDLMNSITPPRLRVYGCATSHRLKSLLDPLSILSL
jgi:hypothetical protein